MTTTVSLIPGTILIIIVLAYSAGAQQNNFPSGNHHQNPVPSEYYDFIVVGTGAGGSIVSTRLAEAGFKVLVIEAGDGSQRDTGGFDFVAASYRTGSDGLIYPDIPLTRYDLPLQWRSTYALPDASPYNGLWNIHGSAGVAAAKKIGGSHILNGMNWYRSTQEDIDGWNLEGWGWDDVLPYYIKSENVSSTRVRPGNPAHGFSGPIQVSDPSIMDYESQIFGNATVNAGYPLVNDWNGFNTSEGFGFGFYNVRRGIRDSAAVAYLMKALPLYSNLHLISRAQVTKILFTGNQAVGVEYFDSITRVTTSVRVTKDVILSAGTFNTAKLLILSGIGPSDELAKLHITPLVINENVGRNIRNNQKFTVSFTVPTEQHPNFYNLWSETLTYAQFGTGIHASTGQSSFAIFKTNSSLALPDIGMNIGLFNTGSLYLDQANFGFVTLRPVFLNGTLSLNSSNALDDNIFYYQNLSANLADVETVARAVLVLRKIMSYPPANTYFGNEVTPGAHYSTLEDLIAFVSTSSNFGGQFHYTGSAKMGNRGDPMAVVDNHTRVNGVSNLRVVDASIFPGHYRGFPQATIVAIAEKASDIIIADWSL